VAFQNDKQNRLLFVIANFIAFFNYTNLATVLAVNLADFLQAVPIGAAGYIVIFVVAVAIIDIVLAGALGKWAILAPVFIPVFRRLGRDPNLVLAAHGFVQSAQSSRKVARLRNVARRALCERALTEVSASLSWPKLASTIRRLILLRTVRIPAGTTGVARFADVSLNPETR
jgi:hypothetical protein